MRNNLFRGKRVDNGECVEGCLLIDYVSGQYFIHASGNSVNESDKIHEDGFLQFVAYEISPETICQYTGLTDKNGRDIFEGDIVKNEYEYIGIVRWECCSFILDWISWNASRDLYIWSSAVEVIGNIFDNPELIETNHYRRNEN